MYQGESREIKDIAISPFIEKKKSIFTVILLQISKIVHREGHPLAFNLMTLILVTQGPKDTAISEEVKYQVPSSSASIDFVYKNKKK